MKESLFEEFEEVSAKQWKQKIQYDLEGANYNEKLVYKSLDGVNVKPFYHADDVGKTIKTPSPKSWNICEKIYAVSAEKGNKKALHALKKGAESIWFIIPSEDISPKTLFAEFDLKKTPVYLSPKFLSEEYFHRLENYLQGKKHRVFLQTDPIGNLARKGNWVYNLSRDHEILNSIIKNSKAFSSVISIDAALYQNSGANIPQQLAYALAHSNEYLNQVGDEIPSEKRKTFQIQFLISSGSNYFFEIAKIKALRWLYASVAKEYNLPETCHIIAEPSRRNKTLYDYNLNLLRTTTESMSAILGGADTISNSPYDAIFHKNNEFGARIARNQLLIMKHESYLGKVANTAEGSYYIESLTRQFAELGLEIFKEIEKGGGFLKQLKEGIIQRKIKESATKEQEQFNSGELILVGTNKYENPEDKMENELQLYPFLKKNPRKTLIEPILERRLSEKYEQERLKEEKAH